MPSLPATCSVTAEPFPTWRTNYREFGGFTVLEASATLSLSDRLSVRLFADNITNSQGTTAWTGRYAPSLFVASASGPNNLVHPSGQTTWTMSCARGPSGWACATASSERRRYSTSQAGTPPDSSRDLSPSSPCA